MPTYTHVQLIGYQVDTFPTKLPLGHPARGRNPNNPNDEHYLGHALDDIDIEQRCKIMTEAIYQARRSGEIDARGTTLKIFMAPEFYFRGRNGAYPLEKISKVAERMRSYTYQTYFASWMFVFGTVLAYLDDGSSKEIFNIAFVQRGGTRSADKDACLLVYKEFVSHIDFIRNAGLSWSTTKKRRVLIGGPGSAGTLVRPTSGSRDLGSRQRKPVGAGREMTKSGLGGQASFVMNGLCFGLEVCLDHYQARLRDSPPARGQPYPQIHLIPSAGAEIVDASVATPKGGLVFNVDPQGVRLAKNDGTYASPSTSEITAKKSIDLDGTKAFHFTGDHDDYFPGGRGQLHLYPAQAVPKQVKKS